MIKYPDDCIGCLDYDLYFVSSSESGPRKVPMCDIIFKLHPKFHSKCPCISCLVKPTCVNLCDKRIFLTSEVPDRSGFQTKFKKIVPRKK